ncbi:MAG: methyltransferase domain-containing protein, partial [Candidatus Omnitrophota bacterium]
MGWGKGFWGSDTLSHLVPYYRRSLANIIGEYEPILMVGCGRGELDLELQRAGKKVTSIDIVPEMVAACREQGLQNALLGDIHNLPEQLKRRSYGCVAFSESIGNMNIAKALRSVDCYVLRPQGRLIITTHLLDPDERAPQYLYRRLPKEKLEKIVKSSGFKIIKSEVLLINIRNFFEDRDIRVHYIEAILSGNALSSGSSSPVEDNNAAIPQTLFEISFDVKLSDPSLDALYQQMGIIFSSIHPIFARFDAFKLEFSDSKSDIGNRIENIFWLMIPNAIDAITQSDRNNGKIRLAIIKKGSELVLETEDNGLGITREHLSLLFERRFSTKDPLGPELIGGAREDMMKMKTEAKALGYLRIEVDARDCLSHAQWKKIYTQEGIGRILESDRVGQGTIFRIILPLQNRSIALEAAVSGSPVEFSKHPYWQQREWKWETPDISVLSKWEYLLPARQSSIQAIEDRLKNRTAGDRYEDTAKLVSEVIKAY